METTPLSIGAIIQKTGFVPQPTTQNGTAKQAIEINLLGSETKQRSLNANNFNYILNKQRASLYDNLSMYDLGNANEYIKHSRLVVALGNQIMGREFRPFEVDEYNIKVLRFLLLYFHHSPLALDVFPDREYKLHKNLFIIGEPGTGKTLIMQVFADYLKHLRLQKQFHNISVTQMMNYHKVNGHIDRFTYNEDKGNRSFEGAPVAVCLNDIGIDTEMQKSYGTSLTSVIDEFLFARYEIYQNRMINYHLTSNMSVEQCKSRFETRLFDRFKTFNVIPLGGASRR